MMEHTIVEQVFQNALAYSEKIAITDGTVFLSYYELAQNIMSAKKILSETYGLKRGDSLIIGADKQLEFVTVYFACHLLGVIVIPLAPDTNPTRFRLIYEKVNPALVVGFVKKNIACVPLHFFSINQHSVFNEPISNSFPDMESIADIVFTTGTTGEPKGVVLSQKNIMAAARNINSFIQNRPDDIEMLALPLSHSFGLGRMRCALSNGQTLVISGGFANLKRFYQVLNDFHITGFGMVPASWSMIKRFSGLKIGEYAQQLHYIEIGSAPMLREDKVVLSELLPDTRICMHYGLTEASRSSFLEFHEDSSKLDTIGKQSPYMMIEIRDEYGQKVAYGTEGEICVKGDAVTVGYYDEPELAQHIFWNDYFRTGDWGIMDQDGYLQLIGRKKELINIGGKKVSPIEVEQAIMTIESVKECACIGIPDPEGILGEVVKAYIVFKQGETIEFGEFKKILSKQLESYKIPVSYEEIGEIPKTQSGKIQRLSLK